MAGSKVFKNLTNKNMETLLINLIALAISLLTSLWLIPFIIGWYKKKKILSEDMNKFSKPKVPGLGGLALVLAFILSITITLMVRTLFGLDEINLELLLPGLLTIIIMAFTGFVDDVLMFPVRPIKPILALFASIPMIAISYGSETILHLPLIGDFNVGLFYPLFIIPFIIIFSSNAINIMADFDGLTPGNGLIMTGTLFICSWWTHQPTAMFLFAALFGTLLVFYFYNKYPAKIFTGNIGTLFIGCIFAIGAIIGHIKLAFFILLIPYILHFILQERIVLDRGTWRARPRERGLPQKNGTLVSEYKKSYGLTHFILHHFKNVTEKKLVYYLMAFEGTCAIIALFLQYQRLM